MSNYIEINDKEAFDKIKKGDIIETKGRELAYLVIEVSGDTIELSKIPVMDNRFPIGFDSIKNLQLRHYNRELQPEYFL